MIRPILTEGYNGHINRIRTNLISFEYEAPDGLMLLIK